MISDPFLFQSFNLQENPWSEFTETTLHYQRIEDFSSLETILNEFLFCTADKLAIKCLGVLGLRNLGLSMQELLEKLHMNSKQMHSKEIFEKMLNEGFEEAHLHRKK